MLQPFITHILSNLSPTYYPIYHPHTIQFITHILSNLSPPDYFLFPRFKIKLKGLNFTDAAEIQEAINGELKKVQTEKFSAAQKAVYMPMEFILNKKVTCLLHVSSI
jgi:hypothetical protein